MSAPRQLIKRRKLERKRLRKRESRLRRSKKQLSSRSEAVFYGPLGNLKMSEVLSDFVAPLSDECRDGEAYNRLLTLGLVAWNAALRPQPERRPMVDDLIGKGLRDESPYVRRMCGEIVDRLIARKLAYFAEYQRPILSFHLEDRGDDYYLSVMSALDV